MFSLLLGAGVLTACRPASPVHTTAPGTPATPPAAPIGEAPHLVQLAARADRQALAADHDGRLLARVRLEASALDRRHRPPLELALVIDTSGSMEGAPIEAARGAALALLDALREGDVLSVVSFDARAQLLVPRAALARQSIAAARASILGMQARGTTDLAAGLQLGLSQLASQTDPTRVRRIVLLSDGVPNDAAAIPGLAEQARASSIPISALGFGLEYDETLLARLAQQSGGRFHRVGEDERLASAFTEEVLRMGQAIAGNVVLSLRPGPGVQLLGVVGRSEVPAGAPQASLTLADLSEGQSLELFVELSTTAHREGTTVELLDVGVDYDDRTGHGGHVRGDAFLSLPSSTDAEQTGMRDRELERDGTRARLAATTLDAITRSRAGDFVGAVVVLDAALALVRPTTRRLDDRAIETQLDELVVLRKTMAAEAKRQAAAQKRAQLDAEAAARRGGPTPTPTVAPSVQPPAPMAAPELSVIKSSHASAIDRLQPS